MAQRNNLLLLTIALTLIVACGPDTIILRPSLDTPQQHVKNGHNLLSRGKIDAANAEFSRAKMLDEAYAPAYVGLALIQGHRGDIAGGFDTLQQARALVTTPEEAKDVDNGFETLQGMRSPSKD